jgi:hypothetical protein
MFDLSNKRSMLTKLILINDIIILKLTDLLLRSGSVHDTLIGSGYCVGCINDENINKSIRSKKKNRIHIGCFST